MRAFSFFILIKAGLKSFEFIPLEVKKKRLRRKNELLEKKAETDKALADAIKVHLEEVYAYRNYIYANEEIFYDNADVELKEKLTDCSVSSRLLLFFLRSNFFYNFFFKTCKNIFFFSDFFKIKLGSIIEKLKAIKGSFIFFFVI